jgi:hypothetical protein
MSRSYTARRAILAGPNVNARLNETTWKLGFFMVLGGYNEYFCLQSVLSSLVGMNVLNAM